MDVYDPKTDAWTQGADLPTLRCTHASAVLNGRIYLISGVGANMSLTQSVEAYDPALDEWNQGHDLPVPRGGGECHRCGW